MSRSTSSTGSISRIAVVTGTFVFVAVALVVAVHRAAEPRIAEARIALLEARLIEVLPPGALGGAATRDIIEAPSAALGIDAPLPIHRIYRDDKPFAAVLSVTAPDGYNGDIDLVIGVDVEARITGVRVTAHRETPGLGDAIEQRRSDWITLFDGLEADDPPASAWATEPRGGTFDAFTGATVTPEAVVRAVHRALVWFESNREAVFAR